MRSLAARKARKKKKAQYQQLKAACAKKTAHYSEHARFRLSEPKSSECLPPPSSKLKLPPSFVRSSSVKGLLASESKPGHSVLTIKEEELRFETKDGQVLQLGQAGTFGNPKEHVPLFSATPVAGSQPKEAREFREPPVLHVFIVFVTLT